MRAIRRCRLPCQVLDGVEFRSCELVRSSMRMMVLLKEGFDVSWREGSSVDDWPGSWLVFK